MSVRENFHNKHLKEIWTPKIFPSWLLCDALAHNWVYLPRAERNGFPLAVFIGLLLQAWLNIPAMLLPSAGPCHIVCLRLSILPCQRVLVVSSLHRRFSEKDLSLDFRWCLISKCPFYSSVLNACFYQGPPKWYVGRYEKHKTLPLRFMFCG